MLRVGSGSAVCTLGNLASSGNLGVQLGALSFAIRHQNNLRLLPSVDYLRIYRACPNRHSRQTFQKMKHVFGDCQTWFVGLFV